MVYFSVSLKLKWIFYRHHIIQSSLSASLTFTSCLQVGDINTCHWSNLYLGLSPTLFGYTYSMLLAPSCDSLLKLLYFL